MRVKLKLLKMIKTIIGICDYQIILWCNEYDYIDCGLDTSMRCARCKENVRLTLWIEWYKCWK